MGDYIRCVLCSSTFIQPCEPTLRDRLPKGEGWRYEVKFDGYRMQVHKAAGVVTLYTCNGADWTGRFPHLAAAPTAFCDLRGGRPVARGMRRARVGGGRGQARASVYGSGRSVSWVKVKCPARREANRNRGELFGERR